MDSNNDKTFEAFKSALGARESGNNYKCKNAFGYLGRWQFGKTRLYDLGYSVNGYAPKGQPEKIFITEQDFLNSTDIQDTCFIRHVQLLKYAIQKNYKEKLNCFFSFSDSTGGKHQIMITLSGLVAGAHLKGTGGIRDFFNTGKDNYDGLNTSISSYITKFNGYNL